MVFKKGFTLMEILVVLVILGILVAIVMPNLISNIELEKAQKAKNNLLAISAAQSKFYEDYGSYCIDSGINPVTNSTTPPCGDTVQDLIANLHLKMWTNDPFSYSCSNAALPYSCTATDNSVTLKTTGSGVTCTAGGALCPS